MVSIHLLFLISAIFIGIIFMLCGYIQEINFSNKYLTKDLDVMRDRCKELSKLLAGNNTKNEFDIFIEKLINEKYERQIRDNKELK